MIGLVWNAGSSFDVLRSLAFSSVQSVHRLCYQRRVVLLPVSLANKAAIGSVEKAIMIGQVLDPS